jgi:hypothetical protein
LTEGPAGELRARVCRWRILRLTGSKWVLDVRVVEARTIQLPNV